MSPGYFTSVIYFYLNIYDEKQLDLFQSPWNHTRNAPFDDYFPLASIFGICQLASSLISNQVWSLLHLYNYCYQGNLKSHQKMKLLLSEKTFSVDSCWLELLCLNSLTNEFPISFFTSFLCIKMLAVYCSLGCFTSCHSVIIFLHFQKFCPMKSKLWDDDTCSDDGNHFYMLINKYYPFKALACMNF